MVAFFRRNARFFAILFLVLVLALLGRVYLPLLLAPPDVPASSEAGAGLPTVTLDDLRQVAKEAIVRYGAQAVVENERIPDDLRARLGAREEIVLLVRGEVLAGFDPVDLNEESLWFSDGRAQVHLPAPKILSATVDAAGTEVIHHQRSLLLADDPDLFGQALEAADEPLRQAALEAGLLKQAARFGQLAIENYLRAQGFTEVRVAVN